MSLQRDVRFRLPNHQPRLATVVFSQYGTSWHIQVTLRTNGLYPLFNLIRGKISYIKKLPEICDLLFPDLQVSVEVLRAIAI